MNIQANLSSVSLIPNPKKAANKPSVPNEDLELKQALDKEENSPLTVSNAARADLFQQVESLDDSQKVNFRFSDIDIKNQKSIQSYLDNQALETQPLRDELHDQLGIDLSV
ncbi:MAG: hypothetical protein AXW16_05245 [Cycloclasticus sp. Phe_18]|jgi:hypothetical protein|nr:MAG: hypothetical protein AXW16_05245 [Cycloclasticus sp. Phe_18]